MHQHAVYHCLKEVQKPFRHGSVFKTRVFAHLMGHTPSTAGTFRKKFRKKSGETLETLSERFLEFPSRVRLGSPKPYNSRHLRLPEHFQNSLPPQYGWGRLFFQKWFRKGPLRAGHGIPSSTGGISDLRDHYERGLFAGGISRISKISKFSRISGKQMVGFSFVLHSVGVL